MSASVIERSTGHSRPGKAEPADAPDSSEEILAYLARVHVLLRQAVRRFRAQLATRDVQGLDGMVIFDGEVDAFLNASPREMAGGASRSPTGVEEIPREMLVESERAIEASAVRVADAGGVPHVRHVARTFSLTPDEVDILMLCLAPEIHPGYGRVFAYLQNDITRVYPTVALILDLLATGWSRRASLSALLGAGSTLLRHRIVVRRGAYQEPALGDVLSLDSAMTRRLLTGAPREPAAYSYAHFRLDQLLLTPSQRTKAAMLAEWLARGEGHALVAIHGPDGSGKRALAAAIAAEAGGHLASFEFVGTMLGVDDRNARFQAWLRDALLDGDWPCLDISGVAAAELASLGEQAGAALSAAHLPVAFMLSEQPVAFSRSWSPVRLQQLGLEVPNAGLRRQAWSRFLEEEKVIADPAEVTAIAGAFPLPIGQIRRAASSAAMSSRIGAPDTIHVSGQALRAAARSVVEHGLERLAERIATVHEWKDIVLPLDQERQLHEIADAVRLRERVLERWGFGEKVCLSPGLSVLFSGASGTGKTLAASILAHELGMELFRVDLSRVVSKYIGETEKNLDALFSEARRAHGILFFDEADALFGKRSEVSDAHDRYANIEVAFLLQRMESFEGVTILATNLRGNLDRAFLRRLQFSVEFPPPDEKLRLAIWDRVWPTQAPLGSAVDLPFLARQFDIPGGYIRNIALKAAYLAAAEDTAIDMPHIIAAARREFQKMGRLSVASDFGTYGHLVPGAHDQ